MKILRIFNKVEILLDDDRYSEFAAHRWYLNKYGYAMRMTGTQNRKVIWLHREVVRMNTLKKGPTRLFVDHIDRNPLNNQQSNLRICTHSQNLANRPKPAGQKGFKGVYWHAGARKWMARITVSYKGIYLGLFTDPKDAARAYDKAATEYFGEFAWTNKA